MTELLPHRINNRRTGRPYTKANHLQAWAMPDGSVEYTGWIEPGDTGPLDKRIAYYEREIERTQEHLALARLLRAGVEAERD